MGVIIILKSCGGHIGKRRGLVVAVYSLEGLRDFGEGQEVALHFEVLVVYWLGFGLRMVLLVLL